MSSLSLQEDLETEKIADQSGIELLPVNLNVDSEPTKKADVVSYHSDSSLTSLAIGGDIDPGVRGAGAKGKKRPQMELIQVCYVYTMCKNLSSSLYDFSSYTQGLAFCYHRQLLLQNAI